MSMKNVITNVRDAVEAPLTEPLDAEHLFLMVGIIIIAWGFWVMVLAHLRELLPVE